jgi:hypothetical protein
MLASSSPDSLPASWNGKGLIASPAPKSRRDSIPAVVDTGKRPPTIRESYPHRILTLAFKPVDWVVRPTFQAIAQPLKPVIRYADSSEVIERTNALIHAGDRKEKRMIYPVASITGNSDSRAGLRYRDTWQGRLGTDAAIRWAPNQQWGVWLSSQVQDFPFEGSSMAFGYSYFHTPSVNVWIPGQVSLDTTPLPAGMVSETRKQFEVALTTQADRWSHSIFVQGSLHTDTLPDRISDSVKTGAPWFGGGDRGTSSRTAALTIGTRAGYSSVDHGGIPTQGTSISINLSQTLTGDGADMAALSTSGVHYLLLGRERYVYRHGDLDPYLNPNPKFIMDAIDPSTMWNRLTERRILAVYWKAVQAWENGAHPAPWFFFPALGGSAPTRAYDSKITGKNVWGGGMEYRWPIWKYIDGSLFAEIAHSGDVPWKVSEDRLAPGWGFGIRVRNQDNFFFRLQLAVGRQGNKYIITTDPEF